MPKYLLDTHIAIWALLGNDKMLSKTVIDILLDKTVELAVSIVSIWEIAIKVSKGSKIPGISGVDIFMNELYGYGVEILGITSDEIRIVEKLPFIHKDPFDRIIVATAMNNRFVLLSADMNVRKYDVPCIW